MGDVVAHGCSSTESPISLIDINNRTIALEDANSKIELITSEEISALFG